MGGFFENLDQRLDEFEINSYGVSMSNLEDVFLRINQEYAPDLFSDLKGHYARKSIRASDNSNTKNQFKSIGHSTEQTSSLDASKGAFS